MANWLLLVLMVSVSAFAAVERDGESTVTTGVKYAVLSVDAICHRPMREDESQHVRFADSAYAEVDGYLNRGYQMKLLSHFCGMPEKNEKRAELSMDKYEKVRVLMIDAESARRDFDAQIKALISSF